MSREPNAREMRRLRRVASEYRKKGYDVQVEPGLEDLPPVLRSLRPDLIAVSGEDRVIVEVKTHGTLAHANELPELARAAAKLGWRFELVLTNPVKRELTDAPHLRRTTILERVEEARHLASEGHQEAAFLLSWSALEGAGRLALRSRTAGRTESTMRLLKTLYSLGGLNTTDHEWLQRAAEQRTRMVHGFEGVPPVDAQRRLTQIISDLVSELEFPDLDEMVDTRLSDGGDGMQQYANRGGDSGVVAYEIGAESVTVEFSDGSQYLYTYASAGSENIEHMKHLAQRGEGLNEFVNRTVRKMYELKLA